MKTGVAHLPLHSGSAPRWLFQRMVKLASAITQWVILEFGTEEFTERLSHPYWFQAFGCVLGFDWHSSGLTTVTCGAIKEAVRGKEKELGFFVAGGKGAASRKTPQELINFGEMTGCDMSRFIYASKMSAKVDNTAVQDGYQLYHHNFFLTRHGTWCVIQQGMNEKEGFARRYHWWSQDIESFVIEPHHAICSEKQTKPPINLVAKKSKRAQETITSFLTEQSPEKTLSDVKRLEKLCLPIKHEYGIVDLRPDRMSKVLIDVYEKQPKTFEQILGVQGVGPKTMRALTLVAELVYDVAASKRDPVSYSFAVGGKDGYPYPIEKKIYDDSVQFLQVAISKAKVSQNEKLDALRRLHQYMS